MLLLSAGAHCDLARNDGATALWISAQMGHDHIVKLLLQNKAFVDSVRCDGATALFKASHKGYCAVVQELLKFRPNLGILPVSKRDYFKLKKKVKILFKIRMVKRVFTLPVCSVISRSLNNY